MSCKICCDTYNMTNKKRIECHKCKHDTCTSCIETYFKTSLVNPQCMKCHILWNHQFVLSTFGNAFVKRLQKTQKEILFTEQKALFPYTQAYIHLQMRKSELKAKQVSLKSQIKELEQQLRTTTSDIYNLNYDMYTFEYPDRSSRNKISISKYIRVCGKNDCKGFVEEKTGTCQLCNAHFCKRCMEEKENDHECDETSILTVEMLKKDSKNCPKCSALIHRISGCPDMFCIHCHTAFNWNTLLINERGNSNPHYYEWLRNNNTISSENRMNTGCVNVGIYDMTRSENYKTLSTHKKNVVMDSIRSIHHRENNNNVFMQHIGSLEYRDNISISELYTSASLACRSKYMRNEITEAQFKTNLMKLHKALEYNSHIKDILRVIQAYKQDMIHNVIYSEAFNYDKFMNEFFNFVEYINETVKQICILFYNHERKYKFLCIDSIRKLFNVS